MAVYKDGTLGFNTDNLTFDFNIADSQYQFNQYIGFGYWVAINKRDTFSNVVISNLASWDPDAEELEYHGTLHFNGGVRASDVTVGELSTVYVNFFIDEDNPTADEVTLIDGLTIAGEHSAVAVGNNVRMTDVAVGIGGIFSVGYSDRIVDEVSIESISVTGGYVWVYSGCVVETINISAGAAFVYNGAAIGDVVVSDRGILHCNAESSVDSITIDAGGLAILEEDPDVGPIAVNAGGTLLIHEYWRNVADVTVKAGSTICFASGMFNRNTDNLSGYTFVEGTVVGYGFDNGSLTYKIGDRLYYANGKEARNYVVSYEDLVIGDGQRGVNLVQDDGGSITVDSNGSLEGARILMNSLVLTGSQSDSGKIHATDIVMDDPYFDVIGESPVTKVYDTAVVNTITANGHSELLVAENGSACNVVLNDNAEAVFYDYSTSLILEMNDNSVVWAFDYASLETVTVNSGVFYLLGEAEVEDMTINGGNVYYQASATEITISGGTVIASDSTLTDVTVEEGARFIQMGWGEDGIWTGAEINNLVVNDGAWICISSAEDIYGISMSENVKVGYNFYSRIGKEDECDDFIVTFMENWSVGDEQIARNLCLGAGNSNIQLLSGSSLENASIENGCLTVNAGATISGKIDMYGDTYVIDNGLSSATGINFLSDDISIEDANFNFMLGQNKQLESYDVNTDWSNLGMHFIGGNYGDDEIAELDISVTVDQPLDDGVYSLYLGTGYRFDAIEIRDADGDVLGYVSNNKKSLTVGNATYELVNLYNSNKTFNIHWGLEVTSVAAPDTTKPTISGISASTTDATHDAVKVTAVFMDDSGTVTKRYRIDNGEWQTYVNGVDVYRNGKITFWAQDAAGNETFAEYDVTNISPMQLSNGATHVADEGVKVWDVQINNGGAVILNYGATADSCVVNSGGALHVSSGATTSNTLVNQSGYLGIGGGATAYDTTIGYAGAVTVYSGGTVEGNTIDTWGAIIVSNGAVAKDTVINSLGGLHVYAGGVASNTTVKKDAFLGIGGAAKVYQTQLDSFGKATLYGGAVASQTDIGYAAELTVLNGGLAEYNTINTWGALILSAGAIGNFTSINAQGGYHIYDGASAYSTTVNGGAHLGVGAGGLLYSCNQENGATITFYENAIVTGWQAYAGSVFANGYVKADGAYINLVLENRNTTQDAILDGLDYFEGVERFSAEVTSSQIGWFDLATDIDSFAGRELTLYIDDVDVGSIGIGESMIQGGLNYALYANNDTLSLEITKISYNNDSDLLA